MEAELISKTVMALPGPTLMEATHVHHVAIVDDEHTGQNAPCIVWTPPRAHHTMPYVIKEPLLHPSFSYHLPTHMQAHSDPNTHSHTHTHTHTHTHNNTHTPTRKHRHTHANAHTRRRTHAYTHRRTHTSMHVILFFHTNNTCGQINKCKHKTNNLQGLLVIVTINS